MYKTIATINTAQVKQKLMFFIANNRHLTTLETIRLKRISAHTAMSFESAIRLYTDFSQNNSIELLFLSEYVMINFFLIWNYGKPEAIKFLKEKVISESGMEDVIELAEQMQNHLYGVYPKKESLTFI